MAAYVVITRLSGQGLGTGIQRDADCRMPHQFLHTFRTRGPQT